MSTTWRHGQMIHGSIDVSSNPYQLAPQLVASSSDEAFTNTNEDGHPDPPRKSWWVELQRRRFGAVTRLAVQADWQVEGTAGWDSAKYCTNLTTKNLVYVERWTRMVWRYQAFRVGYVTPSFGGLRLCWPSSKFEECCFDRSSQRIRRHCDHQHHDDAEARHEKKWWSMCTKTLRLGNFIESYLSYILVRGAYYHRDGLNYLFNFTAYQMMPSDAALGGLTGRLLRTHRLVHFRISRHWRCCNPILARNPHSSIRKWSKECSHRTIIMVKIMIRTPWRRASSAWWCEVHCEPNEDVVMTHISEMIQDVSSGWWWLLDAYWLRIYYSSTTTWWSWISECHGKHNLKVNDAFQNRRRVSQNNLCCRRVCGRPLTTQKLRQLW